jgi:hypothetical protein
MNIRLFLIAILLTVTGYNLAGQEPAETTGQEPTIAEGPGPIEPERPETNQTNSPEITEPEDQEPITGAGEVRDLAVRIFIDCDRCDMNYIREEIPYVNYVRDVKEAQVYLRETSQRTGSGGREYSFIFLGQENFQGMNDTLVYASRPDDTRDLVRRERTDMMKMGLMRYVARTPLATQVAINSTVPNDGSISQQEVVDRWNNWVFRIQVRPSYEGEQSYKRLSFRNSVSATKITHEWKLDFDYDHNYSRTTYTYDDATFKRYRSSQQLDNLVVKSLGDHWSAGGRLILRSSTFNNVDFNVDLFPSLEYNLFPYSESSHHQMRFLYGFGNSFNMYRDTTIYDEIQENRLQQRLQIAYRIEEKWGSVNMSLEGSNYFHDLAKNRVELNGSLQVRIIKGLSLSVYGSVARVNDQLSLAKGELSEADILLRLQELQTAYQFRGNFGITYTFGSIYNNIVNPRFGGGGGGGGFF